MDDVTPGMPLPPNTRLMVSVNGAEPTPVLTSAPLPTPSEDDLIAGMDAAITDSKKPRKLAIMFAGEWTGWHATLWVCVDTLPEAVKSVLLLNNLLRSVFARFSKTWIASCDPADADKPPIYTIRGTHEGNLLTAGCAAVAASAPPLTLAAPPVTPLTADAPKEPLVPTPTPELTDLNALAADLNTRMVRSVFGQTRESGEVVPTTAPGGAPDEDAEFA